jgi:hypothetical protein
MEVIVGEDGGGGGEGSAGVMRAVCDVERLVLENVQVMGFAELSFIMQEIKLQF